MSSKASSIIFMLIISLTYCGVSGRSNRLKRELRFPKGSSFVAAVALTSFLPKGLTDGFVHVLEFDLGFPFPERFAINKVEKKKKIFSKPIIPFKNVDNHWKKKYRVKRNLKEVQRQNFISTVENAIDRFGFKGSECVKRLRCELQQSTPNNSLLEDLIKAVFQLPSDLPQEVCKEAIRSCPFSLLHILFHSQQIDH